MILQVKVIPGASRSEVVGWEGEELRVRLQAPPEKGKANRALLCFLADWLGVSRTCATLLSGEKSRHKRVAIEGVEPVDLERRVAQLHKT